MSSRFDPDVSYRGAHGAPDHVSGAPLHDLTFNQIYPADVYTFGERYYGIGDGSDMDAWSLVFGYHSRPERQVTIYRAVPKGIRGIHPGDWVTVTRRYAVDHGKHSLGGKGSYSILKKLVHAKDIFTAGDSILEWGYDPTPGFYVQRESTKRPDFFVSRAWYKNRSEAEARAKELEASGLRVRVKDAP